MSPEIGMMAELDHVLSQNQDSRTQFERLQPWWQVLFYFFGRNQMAKYIIEAISSYFKV